MNAAVPDPVYILRVPVHPLTMSQTVSLAETYMTGDTLRQIVTTNPEFVMLAQQDAAFLALLQGAALSIPDGVGLLYAARRLGRRLPARVPGSELVYLLADAAARHGWRLFLLGAAPGVAAAAAERLQARYPGLIIAGTYAGSPAAAENDAIVARINASGANLLYVAYGAPRQDQWIARNRDGAAGRSAWRWAWAARSISSPAGHAGPRAGCSGWGSNGSIASSASRGAGGACAPCRALRLPCSGRPLRSSSRSPAGLFQSRKKMNATAPGRQTPPQPLPRATESPRRGASSNPLGPARFCSPPCGNAVSAGRGWGRGPDAGSI